MRTSALLFLTSLLFALSALVGPGAKAGHVPVGHAAESVSSHITPPLYPDYLAVEPVQLTVPPPTRALRRLHERTQTPNWKAMDGCSDLWFSSMSSGCSGSTISLPGRSRQTAVLTHKADYLKFCILII